MLKRIITALLIILGVVLTLYRLEVKKQQDKPINKLYKTSTHSGRPIIFLKDDFGNVQLINPNDMQLIKDLEKKFEVVEEWKWIIG